MLLISRPLPPDSIFGRDKAVMLAIILVLVVGTIRLVGSNSKPYFRM